MPHRRGFFQTLSALPFLAGFTGKRALAAAPARDYLKELGVAPVINGMGAYTMITGSLMWPESVAAIQALSKTFVRIVELHDAVGKRIAQLLECEAAMVPSGAAAGLTLATAACITGTDEALIRRIPDTTGMKNEVLVQKTHRFPYDHMVRNCGVKLIEVETREELEQAISERTALLLFLNKSEHLGRIGSEEFIAIGKRRGVPTLNDAAADVPPVENLKKYTRMGFDLVVFSGGKGIRGPQSAGLLLGRANLIRAARLNTIPYSDTMGRSCKVNKEELVAMLVAVEMYLKHDHAADWKEWEHRRNDDGQAAERRAGCQDGTFRAADCQPVAAPADHHGAGRFHEQGETRAGATGRIAADRNGARAIHKGCGRNLPLDPPGG